MANTLVGSHSSSIATPTFQYYPPIGMGNQPRKNTEWVKYKEGGDFDSHVKLFERTCWANGECTKEEKLRWFPCTLRGDTFDWYSKYENSFPISTWDELKATFGRRYQMVKMDERFYQKMCVIRMGHEEDVEAYYEWLIKLNSVCAPP
jgi:hypothetical protein